MIGTKRSYIPWSDKLESTIPFLSKCPYPIILSKCPPSSRFVRVVRYCYCTLCINMLKLPFLLACFYSIATALGTLSPPCLPVRRDFKLYYPCTGQAIGGSKNDDDYDGKYSLPRRFHIYTNVKSALWQGWPLRCACQQSPPRTRLGNPLTSSGAAKIRFPRLELPLFKWGCLHFSIMEGGTPLPSHATSSESTWRQLSLIV